MKVLFAVAIVCTMLTPATSYYVCMYQCNPQGTMLDGRCQSSPCSRNPRGICWGGTGSGAFTAEGFKVRSKADCSNYVRYMLGSATHGRRLQSKGHTGQASNSLANRKAAWKNSAVGVMNSVLSCAMGGHRRNLLGSPNITAADLALILSEKRQDEADKKNDTMQLSDTMQLVDFKSDTMQLVDTMQEVDPEVDASEPTYEVPFARRAMQSHSCPAHSYYTQHDERGRPGCKCRSGYKVNSRQNGCVRASSSTRCPSHAHSSGSHCYCDKGYKVSSGRCARSSGSSSSRSCPSNAHKSGSNCYCNSGYKVSGGRCVRSSSSSSSHNSGKASQMRNCLNQKASSWIVHKCERYGCMYISSGCGLCCTCLGKVLDKTINDWLIRKGSRALGKIEDEAAAFVRWIF